MGLYCFMLTHPLVSWRSHMHTGQCQENWWSWCKPTIHWIIKQIEYLGMYHLATLYTVTSCFLWVLWLKSGPQSQPTRKGRGNNLAWKCLAGMLRFLNLANILFQIFNAIGQVLLQFSKFLCSTVLHTVISLTRTLVGWSDGPSLLNTDGSIPALKTLPGEDFPRPFLAGWVWGPH